MERRFSFDTDDERPEVIKVYEAVLSGRLCRFPAGFFSADGVIDYMNTCAPIIRYMIEVRLGWSRDEVCVKLSRKTFKENALGGMLSHYFADSPYTALELAYPGEFKPWELNVCTRNFWNYDNAVQAVRWLYDEKLGWSEAQICSMTTVRLYKDYGLDGMLRTCFKDSPTLAILSAYPDTIVLDDETGKLRPKGVVKTL